MSIKTLLGLIITKLFIFFRNANKINMMYNFIRYFFSVYMSRCVRSKAHKGPVIKLQMFSNVKTSRRMIRKDSTLKLTALLSTNYMLQCLAYGLSYFTSMTQTRRHCSPDTIYVRLTLI